MDPSQSQPHPRLKITNNTPKGVFCVINDPKSAEEGPSQHHIAPFSTLTYETSKGDHTVYVSPSGATSPKADARYDLDVSSEEVLSIDLKGEFLCLSRQIGEITKETVPNKICNKTDETLLVVIEDQDGRSFEQTLLVDETCRFYTRDGHIDVYVWRHGQGDKALATASFDWVKKGSNALEDLYFHWEATITKAEVGFKLEVQNIQDHSLTHTKV